MDSLNLRPKGGYVTAILAFLVVLIGSRAPAQTRKLNQNEKDMIDLALNLANAAFVVHPCPEIDNMLKAMKAVPYVARKLGGSSMRTSQDKLEQDKTQNFTEDFGNGVAINSNFFDGTVTPPNLGMDTPGMGAFVFAGLIYAEAAHQDLECRIGKAGDFKGDEPPGTQTAMDHLDNWKASEREAGERLKQYIDWLVSAFGDQMTAKDREQLDRVKRAAQRQIDKNT